MSPTTPTGLPYPNPSDPAANGATDIRLLAEAIPVSIVASGLVGMGADMLTQTAKNAAVTYPVGRFPGVPRTMVTQVSGSPGAAAVFAVFSGSAAGFTAAIRNVANVTLSGAQVGWLAVFVPGAAGGLTEAPAATGLVVTCRTDGCANAGIAIELGVDADEPPDFVVCGVCGNPIDDLATSE